MPLISVIMPCYNAQDWVAQSAGSILAQTFGDFDFIIINDGSTDRSQEILEGLARKDARIRLISRPNTGYVPALNEALALATGEFVARMDADDWSSPERFELQIKRMQAQPDLVALGSSAIVTDAYGNRLGEYTVPLTHEEIEAKLLAGASCIHHPAVMMRTAALQKVNGYRVPCCPCEDFDLWLRLGEVGKLANLPEPLLTKRLTTTGVVASTLPKQLNIVQGILNDAWKRRNLPGAPVLPPRNVLSMADLYRQWAWMALQSGESRTARRYAWKQLVTQPLSGDSWRLAYCALRGR